MYLNDIYVYIYEMIYSILVFLFPLLFMTFSFHLFLLENGLESLIRVKNYLCIHIFVEIYTK